MMKARGGTRAWDRQVTHVMQGDGGRSASRLQLELLGLLPGVRRVAKVAVRGGFEVNGVLQVELTDCGVSVNATIAPYNTHQ